MSRHSFLWIWLLAVLLSHNAKTMAQDNPLSTKGRPLNKVVGQQGKNVHRQTPILTCGEYQIYESDKEAWVFMNVDLVILRSDGASEAAVRLRQRAFHVYVLGKQGLLRAWKTSDTSISANPNSTIFFRHQDEVYAYCVDRRLLFEWRTDDAGAVSFALTKKKLAILPSKQSQKGPLSALRSRILTEANELVFVDSHDGGGRYKKQTYDLASGSLRISFGFGAPKHPWGACSVASESLSTDKWKIILWDSAGGKFMPVDEAR